MKKLQSGFTLIELMIVVAIIGILAAIALPGYQNYIVKAKMSEVMLAVSGCRTTVSEVYLVGGTAPKANEFGCETTAATKYVKEVKTDANGVISAEIQGINSDLDTKKVTLTPRIGDSDAKIADDKGKQITSFVCGSTDTTVQKYLPFSCKAAPATT